MKKGGDCYDCRQTTLQWINYDHQKAWNTVSSYTNKDNFYSK